MFDIRDIDAETSIKLDEAFVSIQNVASVVFPEASFFPDLTLTVGKKLIQFGRVNSSQYFKSAYISRSFATTNFLGATKRLTGKYLSLEYQLPYRLIRVLI